MAAGLFDREKATIERAKTAVDDGLQDPEALRALVQELAGAQEKTVRQANKLLRLSDRTEGRLRDATSKIKEQQQELKAAHNELEGHARRLTDEVSERTGELQTERAKLQKLVSLGIRMAAERDVSVLLGLILDGAMELTNADGATFYLMNDDETGLEFRIVKNKSLGISIEATAENPAPMAPVALYNTETGAPNHTNVVSNAVLSRETVNIPDAYDTQNYDFTGTKKFDASNNYRSTSFLTVPLIPRGGSVIGALQLINAADPVSGAVVPFDPELQGFVEALAAQGAMTIENQKLLTAQRKLMDSFIQLIAGAIDAKSPYTGGHCNRVPELAMMLAEEAHAADRGSFADFHFASEEQWREFRIGAWLHDCGKVTTPEYVVDKATKLETIHNRIHEIRTRFEVLYRDRLIAQLGDRLLAAGLDPKPNGAMAGELESLRDDFAFIANCNIGGEFLDDSAIERLAEIAGRPWTRYFDDRLGLSIDEERQVEPFPAIPVPAEERLLADKPHHVSVRDSAAIERLKDSGFRMDIPDKFHNAGELYNLSIKRGTLTNEERFRINEHIIQTIMMLETLPYPPTLRRIPEYAGGHHETMIGTGYPKKLKRHEMSIPARIMAVADIFEALTATDRPYKRGKSLSESLKIMGFMCKDKHIDPELFLLFLESKTYLRYAEQFMHPDQIDDCPLDGLIETARACMADLV